MALQVQERTARVPRIDRGVRLDDLPDEPAIGTLNDPPERADHARGERLLEAERVAPMATTKRPTLSSSEARMGMTFRTSDATSTWITARSLDGSNPTTLADTLVSS